jgi:cell division protein FtsI/penicillin-binding protein 2
MDWTTSRLRGGRELSRSTPDARRLTVSYSLIAGLFVIAALSQAKLQIIERSQTLKLAEAANRFTQTRKDAAVRGEILASNGAPLALDDDTSQLMLDLTKVPHDDGFYMDLGAASGIPAGEFSGAVESGVRQMEWKQPISQAQAEQIRSVKTEWRADGISIVKSGRREYPLGDSAACLVGIVREGKPLLGLEKSLNRELSGSDGLRKGLVDKSGMFLPLRSDPGSVKRVDGKNLTLTIDSDLQSAAAEAVKAAVVSNKADNGVAVIIQPQTGEVLAMVNYPSFSPYNPDGSDGDLRENGGYDPAYMSALEPGSTFKILTLAKALDTGKVTMSDHVYCKGETEIDGVAKWKVHCDDHKPHGDVTPEMAIAESCNISAATWALKVGRDDFLAYVSSLGLLTKPGLNLPREGNGQYDKKEWAQRLQLADMGFGQAIITSPVSLASAFSMIANDGVRVEPSLIKMIGNTPAPRKPSRRIIKSATAEQVMRCMEAVIEGDSGTGKALRIPGYRLAGKTGTAQKIGRGASGYVANFVGFVPARKPQAVILVMINHPTGGLYHGSAVAGPVFVDLAKAVIRRYDIAPTEPTNR